MKHKDMLLSCKLCPRNCGADRIDGKTGYCKMTAHLRLGRAALHYWEEPCISGEKGSGAVFFSGCTLGCIFCQNYSLSQENVGIEIDVDRLTDIFFELEEKGANNINLQAPTHYSPLVAEAIEAAKKRGIKVPFVYNTSSYENVETFKLFDGLIDIYLPDLKYMDEDLAKRFSHVPDYVEHATKAIEEMVRQTGKPIVDEETGLMTSGTIVRHLVLPGHTTDSKNVIKYLYEKYHDDIYISIMNQYTPMVNRPTDFPELARTLTGREYDKVVDYAISLGVKNAFIQEGKTMLESFIPEFNGEGVDSEREKKVY